MHYDWNFARIVPYIKAFLAGTFTTLELTIIIIFLGTILGILCGFLLRYRASRFVLYPFLDILRALPPLVFILFMYYLLTKQIIGTAVPAFWVCIIALSLNLMAFTADLVRAAIQNVPKGVLEAGLALGMTRKQLTAHIMMPHVFREILPGMTALYIGMLKLSSLASIISVREVVYTAQTVIATVSRSLEAWVIVALIYIILVVPATYLSRWLERRTGRGSLGEGLR